MAGLHIYDHRVNIQGSTITGQGNEHMWVICNLEHDDSNVIVKGVVIQAKRKSIFKPSGV